MIRSQRTKAFKGMLACFLVAIMLVASVATHTMNAAAASKPAISKESQTILVGKKYNLDIKNKIKGATYAWKSSNKKVATVDNRGIVKGIKNGTATITCEIKSGKTTYVVTSKVTIRIPAKEFAISNKVTALNVGQKYDLNRTLTPSNSNDLTTWTSSNTKIAKPDAKGKFTALREGTVTITGTTLSKATDSVTIKVVDRQGTVTNLDELNALLGSGANLITLKTDKEIKLTIPEGDYSNQSLVIDAPKGEITNKGNFKSIEIKQIKGDTFIEEAKGNTINITATSGRVVIDKDATANIKVSTLNADVVIENNGTVEELVVDATAKVTINGTSKQVIPVVITAKDATITANTPIELTVETKITLVLNEGAKGTVIHVASKDLIPTVTGTGSVKVIIGTGADAKEETVNAAPPVVGGGGGGFPGGGTPVDPTPVKETLVGVKQGTDTIYKLTKGKLSDIDSVVVNYFELPIPVPTALVNKLVSYLNDEATTVQRWKDIEHKVETVTGQEAVVTGTKGSSTKTVEFVKDGLLKGRTYTVTVAGNSVTIKTAANEYVLTKVGDDTLKISNAPSNLSFVITY